MDFKKQVVVFLSVLIVIVFFATNVFANCGYCGVGKEKIVLKEDSTSEEEDEGESSDDFESAYQQHVHDKQTYERMYRNELERISRSYPNNDPTKDREQAKGYVDDFLKPAMNDNFKEKDRKFEQENIIKSEVDKMYSNINKECEKGKKPSASDEELKKLVEESNIEYDKRVAEKNPEFNKTVAERNIEFNKRMAAETKKLKADDVGSDIKQGPGRVDKELKVVEEPKDIVEKIVIKDVTKNIANGEDSGNEADVSGSGSDSEGEIDNGGNLGDVHESSDHEGHDMAESDTSFNGTSGEITGEEVSGEESNGFNDQNITNELVNDSSEQLSSGVNDQSTEELSDQETITIEEMNAQQKPMQDLSNMMYHNQRDRDFHRMFVFIPMIRRWLGK